MYVAKNISIIIKLQNYCLVIIEKFKVIYQSRKQQLFQFETKY